MMQFLMSRFLTTKGLTDAQIQLISGHESKKSLEGLPASVVGIGRQGLPGRGSDRRDLMRSTLKPSNSCGTLRTFVGK